MAPALLVAAIAVDIGLGEPPARLHPVVWMGRCLGRLQGLPRASPAVELARGAAMTLAVALGFAALAWIVLSLVADVGWLWWPVAIWLLTSTFAIRGLATAAADVRDALDGDDLAGARRGLRSLCARSAEGLDEPALCSATIESVAENASDSVVAPLFYFAIAGLPGALAYRVINTADAMIGYRGRYEYLGKAAARLDDLLNWIPARITALFIVVASASARAVRAWRRDARCTASPNAGHPMAAMAGVLGVQLAKPDHYVLNATGRAPRPGDVTRALGVYWRASALAVAAIAIMLWWLR